MPSQLFGSDRVLLYDVEPWNRMGYGCPNFGDNIASVNSAIHGLVDEVGKLQLYLMTREDATRLQYPSRNSIEKICKGLNRVSSVLTSRMKVAADVRISPGHSTATPVPWLIHPVPYFNSNFVRNRWLKEYNILTMYALTNMMQHSDASLSLTITAEFAQDIWQYFNEIQTLIGAELLGIPMATLKAAGFLFTDVHFNAYKPELLVVRMEELDRAAPVYALPTEDDLFTFFQGIPANLMLSNLKQYPVITGVGGPDWSGSPVDLVSNSAPGTGAQGGDQAVAPAVIGPPSQ